MNPIVRSQFDRAAKDYDSQRRQLIPCFDDFYGMAVSLVDLPQTSPRILDLGAGTGLLTSFLLARYPNAQVTLIDFSENMIEQARERFGDSPQITYVVGDYTNAAFADLFDAVVSSLSIHHLTHPAKRELFHSVHGLLADEGVFVNADQVLGATTEIDAYNFRRWEEDIARSGLSLDAINASKERRREDINATEAEQLSWLSEAGFRQVDCMYRNLGFAVFYAKK